MQLKIGKGNGNKLQHKVTKSIMSGASRWDNKPLPADKNERQASRAWERIMQRW
jgi:hypothetical protein